MPRSDAAKVGEHVTPQLHVLGSERALLCTEPQHRRHAPPGEQLRQRPPTRGPRVHLAEQGGPHGSEVGPVRDALADPGAVGGQPARDPRPRGAQVEAGRRGRPVLGTLVVVDSDRPDVTGAAGPRAAAAPGREGLEHGDVALEGEA